MLKKNIYIYFHLNVCLGVQICKKSIYVIKNYITCLKSLKSYKVIEDIQTNHTFMSTPDKAVGCGNAPQLPLL